MRSCRELHPEKWDAIYYPFLFYTGYTDQRRESNHSMSEVFDTIPGGLKGNIEI